MRHLSTNAPPLTPSSTALHSAILSTLAYADIFEYPLRPEELWRYLVGLRASSETIAGALKHLPIEAHHGLLMLSGRRILVERRAERAAHARTMWPRARHYGRLFAAIPLVRMVAVTGALAVENVGTEADIDYMLVCAPGRLWLCRALAVALVRVAGQRHGVLCPNYLVSEAALAIPERNLYIAHELAQMVPLAGAAVYGAIRAQNNWSHAFLPNARTAPTALPAATSSRWPRRWLEAAMGARPLQRLETWEMERKITRFARPDQSHEARFGPDLCKGHVSGHASRIAAAYQQRLAALGLAAHKEPSFYGN